jgi:hypothetical protein
MIFADSLVDFILQEGVLGIVRIIATVGGAIVGWFVCDPLTRGLYRLSFRAATPGSLLLVTKLSGAAALSLLIYFYMPLGGGGGGLGWGPGMGGEPGKGKGEGGDKTTPSNGKDTERPADKDKSEAAKKAPLVLEPVEIEIISTKAYKKDGRFYLIKRAGPARTLAELGDYLKQNQGTIEVTPILTRDSFDDTQPDNPLSKLLNLTEDHKVKTLQTKKK